MHFILNTKYCPIHYWQIGNKELPFIVFIHGAGADHHVFDLQIMPLLSSYQLLMWDLPGHGLSRPLLRRFTLREAALTLLTLLDNIGCHEAIVVGLSIGSYIGQEMISLAPSRISAFVSIGAQLLMLPIRKYQKFLLEIFLSSLKIIPHPLMIRGLALLAGRSQHTQGYLLHVFQKTPPHTFFEIWQDLYVNALKHHHASYRFISLPILIIRGKDDHFADYAWQARYWLKEHSKISYTVLENAGHVVNMDNPIVFNATLLCFLQGMRDSFE